MTILCFNVLLSASSSLVFIKILHKAGVIATATKRDTTITIKNAIPKGCNKRPSIPVKKKSGIKEAMMINEEFSIEARTSKVAS